MLVYYDWNTSPNCLKTKIVLYELGIPYEQRDVDRAVLQSAEHRAKFPSGTAPAIEDDGLCISESSAIALYLAEKHGALVPTDAPSRARMYQAMAFESALLAPTVGGEGLFGEMAKPEAERSAARVAYLRDKAQRVATVLGAVLGDGAYFAGDFSVADAQLYAGLAKSLERSVIVDPPRNLLRWHTRMGDRPSVQKARQEYVPYRR